MILSLFNIIGLRVLRFLDESGRVMMLFSRTLLFIFRPPFDARNLLKQIEYVGVKSVPVVLITGAFTGMVLALQSYTGFKRFNAEAFVGTVVALSLTRELGPVLSGLMVSGRVGSAMAAELGTMQVTEQIDALYTLAINPIHYLVVPRFLAALIIMPILTAFADVVGILGGFLISVILLGTNPTVYTRRTYDFLGLDDVYIGLLKACVFGMIIAVIGCYQGLNTRGGAEGVGKATTNAVVISSLLILVANYFITALLF
jgi:phospholipid/cholesterol/gamma-HCH transport system permease protein